MRPFRVLSQANAGFRRRFLYPVRRWFTLQHFTAVMFAYFALTTLSNPSAPFVALAALPLFDNIIPVIALMFAFCSAYLASQNMSAVRFRIALLPLYVALGVLVWYRVTGQSDSWFGIGLVIIIVGILWILRVDVPLQGGGDDHT